MGDVKILPLEFAHYPDALSFFESVQKNQVKFHRIYTLPRMIGGTWRVGYRDYERT